jgi:hypothetical protein
LAIDLKCHATNFTNKHYHESSVISPHIQVII